MPYVGRGGEKLAWALAHFGITPRGWICADLGSHVGGFVDALLHAGASRVYSVDTSYGTLAWSLRQDPRVVVMERTNALHVVLPEPVNLVTCDLGWTRQEKILPHAQTLLAPEGWILTLLKPQYEAFPHERIPGKGRVREACLPAILERVQRVAAGLGIPIQGPVKTPFEGGKGGNPEFFLLLGPFPSFISSSQQEREE